jgi:hypothetical protein
MRLAFGYFIGISILSVQQHVGGEVWYLLMNRNSLIVEACFTFHIIDLSELFLSVRKSINEPFGAIGAP